MRRIRSTATLLCLTALTAAPRAAASPLAVARLLSANPPSIRSFQTPEDREFREKFQQAMKIGARDEMKKLIDRHTDQAVVWIIETAEAIGNAPNDVLFDRMAALREAWKAAEETDFPEKMERYFSMLKPTIRRDRIRMRGEYQRMLDEYWANNEKKDGSTYARLSTELTSIAEAFESIGDYYFASQAWVLVGHCNDEALRGQDDADLDLACAGFLKCLQARDKIGLRDMIYVTVKPRVDQLTKLGFGPNAKKLGPDAGKPKGPTGEVLPTLESKLSFELIDDIHAFTRPSYFLDELYPTWNAISLGKKGSKAPVPRVEEAPEIHRVGSAELVLDADRDGSAEGKADVPIPLRGRLEPVTFEIGEGPARRKVAFLAITGAEKESYQKIEMYLAPQDAQLSIYITPAGSVVGNLGSTPIRIIDEDLNGIYGNPATSWGNVGISKDHYQPDMDSMIIGKGKRAVPFSEYTKIGDLWYQLVVKDGGTSIEAKPVSLKTGKVSLAAKGLKPNFLILKGSKKYENSYFDLVGSKEVEVPVGRYSIYYGMVSKGKKKQLMKAAIIGDEHTKTFEVEEGAKVEIPIGAPYGFDFEARVDEDSVLVVGKSVCVIGRSGERYERVWNAVPRPSVSLRKPGSKRGSKPEPMPAILDQQMIYDTGDWAVAWFPGDLELPNRYGAEAEVQLTEKKNKLFGKIESAWK